MICEVLNDIKGKKKSKLGHFKNCSNNILCLKGKEVFLGEINKT